MISLLIYILIFALVAYLIFWVMGSLGVPEPARRIIIAIVALIGLLWLLGSFLPSYHILR